MSLIFAVLLPYETTKFSQIMVLMISRCMDYVHLEFRNRLLKAVMDVCSIQLSIHKEVKVLY